MTDSKDHIGRLARAVIAYNRAEARELEHSGLSWLDDEGATYVSGGTRIRAFAVDQTGRHWADAYLVAESVTADLGERLELKSRLAAHLAEHEAVELFQMTYQRGRLVALLSPIEAVCRVLDLPDPELFPAENWARSWATPEASSDSQELHLAAHGLIR